ncbi:protein chibby homolog 1-like [Esox lucius]|uniref:Uncharacterized protein n=1 Tax=Esox lucius TaxID=8010 RepID=A0A3P8Z2I5_ESOLU|nr:protein chibby homolog 1-like [Esox lucius]XP_034147543.1 protein chibby homolog 1-like [Esox lucius]XP_034147544.1 protein chibby homolog 1-like [Esox lucius]
MAFFREMWDKLGIPLTALRFPGNWKPKLSPARLDISLSSLYYFDYNCQKTELGPDYTPPALTLGGHSFVFQQGQWALQPESHRACGRGPKDRDRTYIHLRKRNRELQEENNALKLRTELLMDMLAETTAQLHGSNPGEGGSRDSLEEPQPPRSIRTSFQRGSTKRKTKS